jgi:serine/threonine protein kinase
MIGTMIDNYRIEEKLGEGGMGVVYKATDLNLDRTVAIKMLSADLSRDPGLMERFRAEAKAQAHLNHTNIASLYSLLNANGQTGIVMEYLEGETFDEMLRRRGLIPPQEAVPLFRQALLGVGFAHRMGIVHRDIKPSNIMVNKYGVVKVMDFGIAKVLGGQRLTRTGTQVGTVAYMSPEQIRNKPVDIRSDIYSLGVTLYELLTAHLPFESDSDFQVMSDHVNTPPPPPTRHYPYIPRGIEQCVLKALAKSPDERFQTVEEFGAALEHPDGIDEWLASHPQSLPPEVAHTGGTPPPASVIPGASALASTPLPASKNPVPGQTPAPVTEPPKSKAFLKRNRPLLAGAAAVLVAACAIGGYEFLKKPKPQAVANSQSGGSTVAIMPPSSPVGQKDENAGPVLTNSQPAQDTSSSPIDAGPEPATADAPAEAVRHAEQAMSAGRLFEPPRNSAIYWAKQAEQSGSPDATRLEQQILLTGVRQVQRYREARNYEAASALLAEMMQAFPGNPDLRQLSVGIQNDERQLQAQQAEQQREQAAAQQAAEAKAQQQQQEAQVQQHQTQTQQAPAFSQQPQQSYPAPAQPQTRAASFMVEHRHIGFNRFNDRFNTSYCAGFLTISPTGLIRYDCTQTQDQRCDHVSFPASDVKQAKLTRGGGLHIATRRMGNWDFFGQPQQIQGAFEAVTELVSKMQ